MSEPSKRRNLGRGLSALLGDNPDDLTELDKVRGQKTIAVDLLRPGRYQPRRHMDDGAIKDLADSIRAKGILQPILVRRHPGEAGAFEIIAGERRWRAAQVAQLHDVPVIVKDLSDQETLEIALIENLQRESLSPLEEADAYQRLMDEFSHTQEALAQAVGKSRSHVANTLRLLGLPNDVKAMLDDGRLTAGHARALLKAKDPATVAHMVAKRGLNVRQTEKLVQKATMVADGRKVVRDKDADTIALERDISNLLGLKVEIAFHGKTGSLTIHYGTLDQLDDILHRLSHGARGAAHGANGDDDLIPESTIEEDLAALDAGAALSEDDSAHDGLKFSEEELAAVAADLDRETKLASG